MAQVLVFGQNVPVVEVVGAPSVNARVSGEEMIAALQEAGYDAEEAAEVAALLIAEDFDVPSAWALVEKAELRELGVKAGRLQSVMAAFRRMCIRKCGNSFVRLMEGESEKTDVEVAAAILKSKHVPQAPEAKEETGWAPKVELWREYMLALASWLGTIDPMLSRAVRLIADDWRWMARHSPFRCTPPERLPWDQCYEDRMGYRE